jgi:hypothetical protein
MHQNGHFIVMLGQTYLHVLAYQRHHRVRIIWAHWWWRWYAETCRSVWLSIAIKWSFWCICWFSMKKELNLKIYHGTVVSTRTSRFISEEEYTLRPQNVYTCSLHDYKAIITLHSVDWVVTVTEKMCFLSGTKYYQIKYHSTTTL